MQQSRFAASALAAMLFVASSVTAAQAKGPARPSNLGELRAQSAKILSKKHTWGHFIFVEKTKGDGAPALIVSNKTDPIAAHDVKLAKPAKGTQVCTGLYWYTKKMKKDKKARKALKKAQRT